MSSETGHETRTTRDDSGQAAAPAARNPAQDPAQDQAKDQAKPQQHVVKRTRIGGLWVAAALFALVLLLLLIFILENGQRASITYFGAHGHLPLGVALLLAAVLGVLLVVVPGTGRILQLRMTARRHRKIDSKSAGPSETRPSGDGASADDERG